ncbi:MAG: PEP-CTERM sorting domain-containing protein [Planctomycetes bacterium]|nr:PEP-CTERM sorting domain-containing protein [Planctomycetota bacterium]
MAGGHIHVGSLVTTEQGRAATEVTLNALIDYVNSVVPEPSSGLLLVASAICLACRRIKPVLRPAPPRG